MEKFAFAIGIQIRQRPKLYGLARGSERTRIPPDAQPVQDAILFLGHQNDMSRGCTRTAQRLRQAHFNGRRVGPTGLEGLR